MDFKKKWVNTLHADSGVSTLVLHTNDQVTVATVQIEESLVDTMEGSVLDPQERDSCGLGLPIMDKLGKINPLHQGPIFTPVQLVQPNLLPLLQDIYEETRLFKTFTRRTLH